MDDLLAFLRARLDEDERLAQRAEPVFDAHSWKLDEVQHDYYDELAPHIARQSPARTLREVEAMRRIIESYVTAQAKADRLVGEDDTVEAGRAWRSGALLEVLRVLALPYADHEDYRKEWWQ
jgi:hypothetical protein